MAFAIDAITPSRHQSFSQADARKRLQRFPNHLSRPRHTRTNVYTRERPEMNGRIRLFLDSADVLEWGRWYRTGIIYGFTTNPLILERDRVKCDLKSLKLLVGQADQMGCKEVQLQTWGSTEQEMIDRGLFIHDLNSEYTAVVVKVPATELGFKVACKLLYRCPDLRLTITGVYAGHQVLAAEALGADYAAPYLGRMKAVYGSAAGLHEVLTMQRMVRNSGSGMRLLVASLRSLQDMSDCAAQGCDTFTFSPAVAEAMFAVEPTQRAAEEFEAAALRSLGDTVS